MSPVNPTMKSTPSAAQAGTSMIEVLISIVIVVLGLLGLAGLQSRAQLAEAESFQRAQAVILLQDMVDRINSNRRNSMEYVAANLGTDAGYEICDGKVGAAMDLCEWNNLLVGAGESAGGLKVGAMIGARGCVVNISPVMPREFQVAVVWQGVNPTVEPKVTDCGLGKYGNEKTRRALTSNVIIGCLQNVPATGACVTP